MGITENGKDENQKEKSLKDKDVELYEMIKSEKSRQKNCIELIASENFTSLAVMECLGSCLTNKYSEGYPGARYYGGNEYIDKIERLCQSRALEAFRLDPQTWGVNVQPYSGSPANFEVYTALLNPHDRIMGLDLPSGGHLTHGFYTAKKKVSATSIYFESLPYKVKDENGWLDYDDLHKHAKLFRPKLIIAGMSAYPRNLDYERFRKIADDVGSILMSDMAHVSGLVAAGDNLVPNPFDFCDVVTSTSHKTLRGPRAGMIFYNKNKLPEVEQKINEAVFPSLQGGPHNHQIAALACQLKEVASPDWRDYCRKVISNSKALANALMKRKYSIVTEGTDCHLILWDLRPQGISGGKMQLVCDAANITLNKNSVFGDVSAASPSGVRIGTPAMTTRGLNEEDFEKVAECLHTCVDICQEITSKEVKAKEKERKRNKGKREIKEKEKGDRENREGKERERFIVSIECLVDFLYLSSYMYYSSK